MKNTVQVTVNDCAPAVLVSVPTINGNTKYAWNVCGRLVFISDTACEARKKMKRAIADKVTF